MIFDSGTIEWIEVFSSFFMGFIVMWLAFYFFAREDKFGASEYAGFISTMFGGAIIEVYTTQLTDQTRYIFWFYPIGLMVAMIVYWGIGGKVTFRRGSRPLWAALSAPEAPVKVDEVALRAAEAAHRAVEEAEEAEAAEATK
jgi:hypothetical protein